jgi:hypothetical protein
MKPVYFHLHGVAPILSESQFSFFRPDSAGKNLFKTYFQVIWPVFYEHPQLPNARKTPLNTVMLAGRFLI